MVAAINRNGWADYAVRLISMLGVLGEDDIRTACAKGVRMTMSHRAT